MLIAHLVRVRVRVRVRVGVGVRVVFGVKRIAAHLLVGAMEVLDVVHVEVRRGQVAAATWLGLG